MFHIKVQDPTQDLSPPESNHSIFVLRQFTLIVQLCTACIELYRELCGMAVTYS
jgi:hypothetical protein